MVPQPEAMKNGTGPTPSSAVTFRSAQSCRSFPAEISAWVSSRTVTGAESTEPLEPAMATRRRKRSPPKPGSRQICWSQ